jgi:hypothetical protein
MAQFRKDTHQYLTDGKTIFEVMMLADQYGNLVGPANPSGSAVDAFGRARMSQPYTLYDSFHRYADNGKENTANTSSATYSFNSSTSSIDMVVNGTSGQYCYRESKKIFAYQPGKSLQILKTFVMSPHKTNLRQRVGYFDTENGFFLERSDATTNNVSFVKRSKVTGSAVDTRVDKADWNIDKLDGTGPSLLTLDLDNPQILFIDIEWLGVGSVRMGFVINGQFIHCHTFHHSNLASSAKGAYMQTACLPIRSEIENVGATSGSSTYKQICATVISEGGFALSGRARTYGHAPNPGIRLTTAGTYYPVLSIRLNPSNLGALVIPKEVNFVPLNSGIYRYKLVLNATVAGAVWTNAASDSFVQYNSNTTATMSGGDDLISGFVTSTVQAGGSLIDIGEGIFRYQLERNSFTSTSTPLTLAITCDTATVNCAASASWEEIT